ncbi:MAG: hypothetical protein HY431_03110 [Candidatus Levybacteria bacterium]|nr:hypothetical protein [Candidatus Levybacteria bacterium]
MPRTEGDRLTPDQIYPSVRSPIEQFGRVALSRVGQAITEVVLKEALSCGFEQITIEQTHTGENPQHIIFQLVRNGEGSLAFSYTGDLDVESEIQRGEELVASFNGTFRRRLLPEDEKPIVKPGDHVLPGGTIGVGKIGKGEQVFLVPLPERHFPKGGTVIYFSTENEIEVQKGETVICRIEKTP